MKHSVFTLVMPEYDIEQAVAKVAEWGYDGIEWRLEEVPDPMPAVPNFWSANRATLNIKTIAREGEHIRRLTERHGLQIPSLGTYVTCGDIESVKVAMEGAKVVGAPQLRVLVPGYDGTRNYNDLFAEAQNQFAAVETLAKQYKVKALVEIHLRTITPSASAAYRFVSAFNPEHVGVIYDPGNMIYEGMEDWRWGVELLGKYLAHVHAKNARWEVSGGEEDGTVVWQPTWGLMQTGYVHWKDVLVALKRVGYDDWVSNENFATGLTTEEKLKSDVAYLRALERSLAN
jgi:sugar phosphate isomerase/epimerase